MSIISGNPHHDYKYCHYPHLTYGETESQKLSHLSHIIQLVSGDMGVGTHARLPSHFLLNLSLTCLSGELRAA